MKKFAKIKISILSLFVIMSMVIMPMTVLAASTEGVVVKDGVVTGYTGTDTAVAIPDTAKSIAAGAFAGKKISSVIIPSSIESIGEGAFKNCTSLNSVTIPGSVTSMGTGVFAGCSALSSVSLQASIYGIPDDTFSGCGSLSSVGTSSNISSIGSRAFKGCSSLATMSVPGGVTNIGSEAFANCSALSGISIPASTTSIATDAFRGCASLNTIKVDSGNGTYASDGGCLYNGSCTKLLIVPAGKSNIALNSSVKTIGAGSFNGCTGITTLTLPSSTTIIESGAFAGSGINTITIPSAVTSIADQGGWTPELIYGYTKTTADEYASSRNIVFYPLDGNLDETDTDSGAIPGLGNFITADDDEDDGELDYGGDDEDDFEDIDTKPSKGNGGYSNTTGNSHKSDKTPKTGDFLNARIWICIAIGLVGMAFFIVAAIKRKNKD